MHLETKNYVIYFIVIFTFLLCFGNKPTISLSYASTKVFVADIIYFIIRDLLTQKPQSYCLSDGNVGLADPRS